MSTRKNRRVFLQSAAAGFGLTLLRDAKLAFGYQANRLLHRDYRSGWSL